jgi:hypothetical protein
MRHQPEQGADSPASLIYYRYRVHLEEEVGGRFWLTVPKAMGPNDARNQAIEKAIAMGYFDVTALEIEKVAA